MCSGPGEDQCVLCTPGMVVENGLCIESVPSPGADKYWFPFLVLSCIWLIFALLYKLICR